MKILGVDFDNTLACYDSAFFEVALSLGLAPAGAVLTKQQVKAHLHGQGRYDDWTRLQGLVYGPDVGRAHPFPHALATLQQLRRAGWRVYIVSHKTRYPVIGERHDLHRAAAQWLLDNGFSEVDGTFFEETRAAKIRRIADLGCQAFVDDLPEVFADEHFPPICKVLFDPHHSHGGELSDWNALPSLLHFRNL